MVDDLSVRRLRETKTFWSRHSLNNQHVFRSSDTLFYVANDGNEEGNGPWDGAKALRVNNLLPRRDNLLLLLLMTSPAPERRMRGDVISSLSSMSPGSSVDYISDTTSVCCWF